MRARIVAGVVVWSGLLSCGAMAQTAAAGQDSGTAAQSAPSSMQDGRRPGPPTPEQALDRMDRRLALTDAQKSQILPILQHRQTEMATLRQSGDPTTEREAMRNLMDTTNKQIRALLTAPQQKTFDTMRAAGRGGRGSGGPGPGGLGAGAPDQAPPPPPQ